MRVVFGYKFSFKLPFTCVISSWRFFVVEQRALARSIFVDLQKLGWRCFGSFEHDWKLNQVNHWKKSQPHTSFLDTLFRRNKHGDFSTSVYRKPTNSNRYLNFRSDHPLEHKHSVVRSLTDRANALCSTTKNRQGEITHVKGNLKLNLYPNTTLIKKPSNHTEQQLKGFAIIPYYPGLTEKIRRCLSNHSVKTVLKPCNTIGKKFANHKD